MKRYLVFMGDTEIEKGWESIHKIGHGWTSYQASFDSVQEARSFVERQMSEKCYWKWWHIVDSQNAAIVVDGER